MKLLSYDKILSNMKPGVVYRRSMLLRYSNNLDRDLKALVTQKKLKRAGAGLYYKPKQSRFGDLPPSDRSLIKAFIKKPFLMYSWNDYNALGLGLTQLYNDVVVYNYERHGKYKLGGRTFIFKRPSNGFPSNLSPEFLLVDLLNNEKYLTEDVDKLRSNITKKINDYDVNLLLKLSNKYGKVATKKFFKLLLGI